ncbi:hypothetical protein GDO78_008883 [Eleutherodactylus coqui]|uniref:Uncharacterized protein n=1 Tax=Eleutherodactylus coqui TaxID=57060 RepID=A0A8J6FFG6_ELECQ|nr:hypothetical protein GDO78_008883 [Eleutherodactylus coqui]
MEKSICLCKYSAHVGTAAGRRVPGVEPLPTPHTLMAYCIPAPVLQQFRFLGFPQYRLGDVISIGASDIGTGLLPSARFRQTVNVVDIPSIYLTSHVEED